MACALTALVVAGPALAHKGEFAKFNYCPSSNSKVEKCLYSVTTGGKVVLGKKTVPIVNPVTLQGGISAPEEEPNEQYVSRFFGATNGETLSKTPQPVPGGLSGLVNCKEISLGWLRASCEALFENGLTGVDATLELARPASEIRVSELNILFAEGVALRLPVRVHLENPLLGSSCYVGSSSSPLIWDLTAGTTSPPSPNTPISGRTGEIEPREGGLIAHLKNNELVENAWSAPGATGCGGFLVEYILNPIINASVGLPSAAGKNTSILKNEIDTSPASVVNEH